MSIGAVVLMVVLYGSWDYVQAAFGDPDGLTGRNAIWPVMTAYIRDHWLLGSGYGAFWNVGDRSPVFAYTSVYDWVSTEVANGHNGYLDILAQLGVPGLVLAVWAAIIEPLGRLCFNYKMPRQHGALLVALIVFCAAHNLTESSLFDRDMYIQVVLMFAIAMIAPASVTPTPALPFREPPRVVA
jgi:O-antigen ligase